MGLDSVEFVIDLEKEFGIEIADANAPNIRTIGDVVRYVAAKRNVRAEDVDAIRQRVITLAAKLMKLDPATITDESDLARDLGMD